MLTHDIGRTLNIFGVALKRSAIRASLIICLLITVYTSPAHSQSIFVSPTGDDTNNGSAGSPVRTFQVAADLAASQGATTVQFADGEYVFDATAVLNTTHNGIAFVAADGANPVFSSLVQVTGWELESGNIMVADLPAGLSHVRFLADRSENWMERSATDFFSTTETAGGDAGGCIECNNYTPETQADMSNIRYPASFAAPDWTLATQYDLRATTLPWHQEILPIASVNTSTSRIFTAVPGLYDLRQDVQEAPPRAWVLNSFEGIDTPGEWACLDGEIFLWPASGTDDIYVPQLTELIRVDDGTVDGNAAVTTPVSGITLMESRLQVLIFARWR